MGKSANNQKPPETTTLSAVPPVDEVVAPILEESREPSQDLQEEAPARQVYRANWKLDGLPSGNLEAGDTVELDEETAAPLVEGGVLSPIEGE